VDAGRVRLRERWRKGDIELSAHAGRGVCTALVPMVVALEPAAGIAAETCAVVATCSSKREVAPGMDIGTDRFLQLSSSTGWGPLVYDMLLLPLESGSRVWLTPQDDTIDGDCVICMQDRSDRSRQLLSSHKLLLL
jgi:hypothetical protein